MRDGVEMSLRYTASNDKVLETLVFISSEQPGIDEMYVHKILYFADKDHLNKYGRPIVADRFVRMDHGPVASLTRDMIHTNRNMLGAGLLGKILKSIIVEAQTKGNSTFLTIKPSRELNLGAFSRSDLAILRECVKKYGKMPFHELSRLSKGRPYKAAAPNEDLDYALFIDDSNPSRTEIVNRAQEFAVYGTF